MKLHYITLGIVDFEDLILESLQERIEDSTGSSALATVISVETQELEAWEDSNPLNFENTSAAEFKRLFNKE